MALCDVQHQESSMRAIQRALKERRVPHAYLFHGPDGVGKERFARGLAQYLLCSHGNESLSGGDRARLNQGGQPMRDACGQCEDCRAAIAGTHPDLHLVHRQLNRQHPDPVVRKRTGLDISVDVVRHFIIHACGLTPLRGRAKVFIIREADRITPQAQNALLKTLEEPPNRTFIILLAASLDSLLPTTQSRCQLMRFDLLPTEFVEQVVEHEGMRDVPSIPRAAKEARSTAGPSPTSSEKVRELTREQIRWYARLGQGSAGAALEYVAADLFSVNQRIIEPLARTREPVSAKLAEAWYEVAKNLAEFFNRQDPDISDTEATRRALKTIFLLASTYLADLLHIAADHSAGIVNERGLPQSGDAAALVDRRRVAESIQRLALAERQLDLNANVQLVLDALQHDLAKELRGW